MRRGLQEEHAALAVLPELRVLGAVERVGGEPGPAAQDDAPLPRLPQGPHRQPRHVPPRVDVHRAPAHIGRRRPCGEEVQAGLVLAAGAEEGAATAARQLLLHVPGHLPVACDRDVALRPVLRGRPPRLADADDDRLRAVLDAEGLLEDALGLEEDRRLQAGLAPLFGVGLAVPSLALVREDVLQELGSPRLQPHVLAANGLHRLAWNAVRLEVVQDSGDIGVRRGVLQCLIPDEAAVQDEMGAVRLHAIKEDLKPVNRLLLDWVVLVPHPRRQ
mmetsp:Transcript_112933/g.364566  ORF Transcript_112933/g.364566 Transcript_112933/m.364566 type:complete len:274 (-) Transcript_112933:285-1106(-)